MTKFKSQNDYLKEIADSINNAKVYEIESPTVEDVKKLKDFDYIITPTDYFSVRINKRYKIDTFLGIPTVMWYDGFEIGDSCMGMIPLTYTAEDVIVEMKAFKGDIENEL